MCAPLLRQRMAVGVSQQTAVPTHQLGFPTSIIRLCPVHMTPVENKKQQSRTVCLFTPCMVPPQKGIVNAPAGVAASATTRRAGLVPSFLDKGRK
jgi:hypothetical protein